MRALRRSFVLYARLCGCLPVLQAQRWEFAGHNLPTSYILENGSPAAVQTTDVAILYNGVPVTTDENNPASGPLFSPGLFGFGAVFLPLGTPVDANNSVMITVEAWDTRTGGSFEAASARASATFEQLVNPEVGSGLSNFQGLSIAAAPEPATPMLLTIGVASLAFGLRWRGTAGSGRNAAEPPA